MITIKKWIITIFAAALLSGSISMTAYASEIASANAQTTPIPASKQESQEASATATPSTNDTSMYTDGTDLLSADGMTGSEQEPVLGEGYFIDEQGQIYYDETSVAEDDPIIIDDPVLDEGQEDNSEDSKDSGVKDKDTKSHTSNKATDTSNKATGTNNKATGINNKAAEVKKPSYSEEDLRVLACLIYSEAGNQNYKGMLAVANVVLNRVKSDLFWHAKTIKAVIYDRKWSVQFAVTIKSSKTGESTLDKALKSYDTGRFTGSNPEAKKKAMDRAIKAAKAALEGKNNIGGYLCFQNKRSLNSIKKHYSDYIILGDHVFYRTK